MEMKLSDKLIKKMWDEGKEYNPNLVHDILLEYTELRKELLYENGEYLEEGLGVFKVSKRKNSPGIKSDKDYTAKVIVKLDSNFKNKLVDKVNEG